MLEKIRNLKNKKGFTLVELIVVLVILAILAALLVPALTGYIDKANKQAVIAETRSCVMAAQTLADEAYGKTVAKDGTATVTAPKLTEVKELAEVDGTIDNITLFDGSKNTVAGKIETLEYTSAKGVKCTYHAEANSKYSDGHYDVEGKGVTISNSSTTKPADDGTKQ